MLTTPRFAEPFALITSVSITSKRPTPRPATTPTTATTKARMLTTSDNEAISDG
jgi:hypothetical protein